MKSDIFKIDDTIELNEKVLDKMEALANYHGFDARDVLIVRLLAEEGIRAVSNILEFNDGELWIETKDNDFDIYIKVNTFLEENQKKDIIELSKSKINTPRKGILGKISMIMDEIFLGGNINVGYYNLSSSGINAIFIGSESGYFWAMNEIDIPEKKNNMHKKDDLYGIEQTIIEKFATNIIVTALTTSAELVIKKSK